MHYRHILITKNSVKNLLILVLGVVFVSCAISLQGQKLYFSSTYYEEGAEIPKSKNVVFNDGDLIYAYFIGKTDILLEGHDFDILNNPRGDGSGNLKMDESVLLYRGPKAACFEVIGSKSQRSTLNSISVLKYLTSFDNMLELKIFSYKDFSTEIVTASFQVDLSNGKSKYLQMLQDFEDKIAINAPESPQKGLSDPDVEKIVNEEVISYLAKRGIKATTVEGYFINKEWRLVKNEFSGIVKHRNASYIYRYKRDDNRCFYIEVSVRQEREEAGKYQRPYLLIYEDSREPNLYKIVQEPCR